MLCDVGIEARRADHDENLRLRAACDGEAVLGIAWQEHESPRCGRPPLACAMAGQIARQHVEPLVFAVICTCGGT